MNQPKEYLSAESTSFLSCSRLSIFSFSISRFCSISSTRLFLSTVFFSFCGLRSSASFPTNISEALFSSNSSLWRISALFWLFRALSLLLILLFSLSLSISSNSSSVKSLTFSPLAKIFFCSSVTPSRSSIPPLFISKKSNNELL